MKRIALLITVLLSFAAFAPAISASDAPEYPLFVSEICFNPTYTENDKGVSDTSDVFEFVELVNISNEDVSIDGAYFSYIADGAEAEKNAVVCPEGAVIPSGKSAVFCLFNKDTYDSGYTYKTDADMTALYGAFAEFYNCKNELSEELFFLFPAEGADGKAIDGTFRLGNSILLAELSLISKDGAVLADIEYSSDEWSRNGTSLNFILEGGKAVPFNVARSTPGTVLDNQISAFSATPEGEYLPVSFITYDICAEESEKDGATFESRAAVAMDYLSASGADIIALCEANYKWMPYIEESLTGDGKVYEGYGVSSNGASFGERQNKAEWDITNLILYSKSKFRRVDEGVFWLSSTPDKVRSLHWSDGTVCDRPRAVCWVILEDIESGTEIFVLAAQLDTKSDAVRANSASLIVEQAKKLGKDLPVIITGNLLTYENTDAYKSLSKEFCDARYIAPSSDSMKLAATDSNWGETGSLGTRLATEYFFVSRGSVAVASLATEDIASGGVYPSDHNAVKAAFNVAKAAPEAEDTEAPEASESTLAETETGAADEKKDASPLPFVLGTVGAIIIIGAVSTVIILKRGKK